MTEDFNGPSMDEWWPEISEEAHGFVLVMLAEVALLTTAYQALLVEERWIGAWLAVVAMAIMEDSRRVLE